MSQQSFLPAQRRLLLPQMQECYNHCEVVTSLLYMVHYIQLHVHLLLCLLPVKYQVLFHRLKYHNQPLLKQPLFQRFLHKQDNHSSPKFLFHNQQFIRRCWQSICYFIKHYILLQPHPLLQYIPSRSANPACKQKQGQ